MDVYTRDARGRLSSPKGVKKGKSGRKKGTPNKYGGKGKWAKDAKALCRDLLSSAKYQQGFRRRLEAGTLAPALETLIWHYAQGKPAETVDVNVMAIGRTVDEFHDGPPPKQLGAARDALKAVPGPRPVDEE